MAASSGWFEQLSTVCESATVVSLSPLLHVRSVDECEQRCRAWRGCTAFDTDGRSNCYLKSRCDGPAGTCTVPGWCAYRYRPRPPSVCILVARWGEWPPWLPLLLRALASNDDVRFTLIGDHQPASAKLLPANVRYAEWQLPRLLLRLRKRLHFSAGRLVRNNHSTSKISDLKPAFGDVFPELIRGCDFWGNMQARRASASH